MIDCSRRYPIGWDNQGTEIYIGDWYHPNWSSHERELLEWLKCHPNNSKFSWERSRSTMIFECPKMANLFVLRWS